MNKEKLARVALGGAVLAAGAAGVQAQDASGAYFGLQGAAGSGENEQLLGTYDVSGSSFGAFGGYNFVNGDWTYGVELAYQSGFDVPDSAYDPNTVEKIIDLRARFGRTFGNTFVYGSLGYSKAELAYYDGALTESADGVNYGVGVETTFQGKYFVGLDVMSRRLNSDNSVGYSDSVNLTTGSLRVGMRF